VSCLNAPIKQDTCSKNCANQWELNPGKKGTRQLHPFELENMAAEWGANAPVKEIRVTRKKVTRINTKGEAETVTLR
jgi:UPF0176 protein